MIASCLNYIRSFLQRGAATLLKLIRIQLYIFLVALPILAAWALPLSYGALWGNLLCTPCMILFLGISLCWTVAYFLGLPLGLLSWLLNMIAEWWVRFLVEWGSASWLCAVPPLSPLVGCMYGMLVIFILYGRLRGWYGIIREVMLLLLLAGGTIISSQLMVRYADSVVSIPLRGKIIMGCWYRQQPCLVDAQGALYNGDSLEQWATWTARPALIRAFGVCRSDLLIIMKPTRTRLAGALRLVRRGLCKTIGISEAYRQLRWVNRWVAEQEIGVVTFLSVVEIAALQNSY